MKQLALLSLLALAACGRPNSQSIQVNIPDTPQNVEQRNENYTRAIMNDRIKSEAESVCINGVVYYGTMSGQSLVLAPAFANKGRGTIDCDGGIKIPIHNVYEQVK